MQFGKSLGKAAGDAGLFVATHLNETGIVEEFIDALKEKIKDFDTGRRKNFVTEIINCIKEEKAKHDSFCSLEKCRVKEYFEKCLEMLGKLLNN